MAGINRDTPITVDADFKSILGIENITNLMSDGDLSGIHVAAVNALYRRLLPRIKPEKVLAPNDWKEYLITWAARMLFEAKALEKGGDTLWDKVTAYDARLERLWTESLAATEADLNNDGIADRRSAQSLPAVFNQKDLATEPHRGSGWPWE